MDRGDCGRLREGVQAFSLLFTKASRSASSCVSCQGRGHQYASEKWQEFVPSEGFLFYINFSLHFPWMWLIFWPNLLAVKLHLLEGPAPL